MSLILLLLVVVTKELSKITFDPLSGANTTNTFTHRFDGGVIQWGLWELPGCTRFGEMIVAKSLLKDNSVYILAIKLVKKKTQP